MTTLVETNFWLVTAMAGGHKVYYARVQSGLVGAVAGTSYWTPDPSTAEAIRIGLDGILRDQLLDMIRIGTSNDYISDKADLSTLKLEPVRVCYFVG